MIYLRSKDVLYLESIDTTFNQTLCQSFYIPHPTSHIPHPTSHIPHPTFHIPHPTFHIPHPTSHIPYPTSHIPHPTSHIPHPTSHIPHPTSHIPHPIYFTPGLKPQPWRPKRNAKRSVGAKHLVGSKGREVLCKGREV